MPAIGKNQLHIKPLPGGRYLLHGYVDGHQLRKRSTDLAALTEEKTRHELAQLAREAALVNREQLWSTWMDADQKQDAEAAMRLKGTRATTLQDLVAAAIKIFDAAVRPVPCQSLLDDWQAAQKRNHIREITMKNNRYVVRCFLAHCHVEMIGDITAAHVDAFVLDPMKSPGTQHFRAGVVNAFLNFAVEVKALRANPSTVKFAQLRSIADKAQELPRIVTPAQARALLETACTFRGGRLAPFLILSLWCFMRSAEVRRTTGAMIHLDKGRNLVAICPHKRGPSYRVVTIPANVLPLIKACIARGLIKQDERIFYSKDSWAALRTAAGLGAGRWQANLLRHSGISYHFNQPRPLGGDIKDTCRQAGNSPAIAFKHYMNIPKQAEAVAFFKIKASLPAAARAPVMASAAAPVAPALIVAAA